MVFEKLKLNEKQKKLKRVLPLVIIFLFVIPINYIAKSYIVEANNIHYIYIDSNNTETTIVSEPINIFDKIYISVRTYKNSQDISINLNRKVLKIISENISQSHPIHLTYHRIV